MKRRAKPFAWGTAFLLLALLISQVTTDRTGYHVAVVFPLVCAAVNFAIAWRTLT